MDIDRLFEKCMKGGGHRITATDVSMILKSPFYIYCKHFVDSSEKDPISDYQLSLIERGVAHESSFVETQYPDAISTKFDTPEEGFRITLDAMADGTRALTGCPLFYLPLGMSGLPDILEKRKGRSNFGSHYYAIKEIKLARNITSSHVIQAAFYNLMIGNIQGHIPEEFYLVNMDCEEFAYRFDDHRALLDDAMQKIQHIRDGQVPSPTYGSCPHPWESYCNKKAIESGDISMVGGIGQAKKDELVKYGMSTIYDLASSSMDDLLKIRGIGKRTADNIMASAKSITEKTPVRKKQSGGCQELPRRKTEIFLDLEGLDMVTSTSAGSEESGTQSDYLIGLLVRNGGDEEYVPFVAHEASVDGERQMLAEFLRFMNAQHDYAIYHWHHYEKTHLEKIMARHGMTEMHDAVLSPDILFDLHKTATSKFAFPVPGTSLKQIARWMGFEWRHSDVDALGSIVLYHRYASDPAANRSELDLVLDYNKDDCIATRIVKDWLIEHWEDH